MNHGLLHIAHISNQWLLALAPREADGDCAAAPCSESLTDQQLFLRVQRGDQSAMNAFIQRHGQAVYSCIKCRVWSADLVDDLFQETWIRVIERCHTWRPGSPVGPWLYRVAVNVICDHARHHNAARRGGSSEQVSLDVIGGVMASSAIPADERVAQNQQRSALHKAVLQIPEPYGEVVRLRYFEELSVTEVAEILNCAPGTVKSRLARGLAILQHELEAAP